MQWSPVNIEAEGVCSNCERARAGREVGSNGSGTDITLSAADHDALLAEASKLTGADFPSRDQTYNMLASYGLAWSFSVQNGQFLNGTSLPTGSFALYW
jgi:hypothetical protein